MLINEPHWVERAEILREKGTNRKAFFRGQVDKYSWVDIGSSYLPSEITAAFLWAQLEAADTLTRQRLTVWHHYHDAFAELEQRGLLRRPIIPPECQHNGHLYYVLFPDLHTRSSVLEQLNQAGINAVFHYIPLHSSPAGQRYGRVVGTLARTDQASACLLRLPLWVGMREQEVSFVIETLRTVVQSPRSKVPG